MKLTHKYMSKKYYFYIFSILLVIAVLAYFLFKPKSNNIVQTEQRIVVEKVYVSSDTTKGALSINFDIEMPVFYSNDSILTVIKNTIYNSMFGEKYLDLPQDSIVRSFVALLKDEYRANNADLVEIIGDNSNYSFDNEHQIEGFSLISDENIYSYGISRYVYMGGAHGLNSLNYFVFDLKKGKMLTEDDIFIQGYQENLSSIIRDKIIEDSYNNEEIPDIVNLDNTDYYVDKIVPNSNFYINDEGICYVYNVYEIGPHYLGATEVCIPIDRIRHLLKADNCISYLFKKDR